MDFVRLDPVDYNVEVVRSTFTGLLSDVAAFAGACVDKLIEVFKDLAIKAVRALFGENAPAYDLICQVLGRDPLTGETREWNTADFLRSVLRLFGFENHLAKMEETGQVEKAAAWLEMQVGLLISAYSGLILGVIDLWTSLSLEKLIHPEELLAKTLNVVLAYVSKLALFAFNLASKVLELIKEALITLLKAHVHKVPGYPLFTVVLGKDPVTGEEVPRTPENFLKGFLSFVPRGIETYENIKASGALPKAMAWLLGLINELGLSPSQLVERFLTLWNSFSIDDLMNPIGAYIRIAETYLGFVGDVLMLVLRVYWKVLEIMFVFLLGPGAARVVAALKQGENTFRLIIEDPVGFFGNLLGAIGKGIKQFGSNIWKHIQGGLIGWMLGSLQGAGIEMPEKFDLKGVVSIVMQLLGLTYRQVRPILVKRLGENVVSGLEATFEFLRLFLTEGFAGVWQQFLEWVGDLKGIVIQAVTEWVVTKIVMVGLSKLATLWNPVGWAVEAVLAIYNTVMFFIERMEQILDFVEAVIQSINNIATGKLQQAADYVESAMARTIPVIISFCTSLIGLGGISSKIRGVIQKVQDKVHKAIDTMVAWIVKQAAALIKAGTAGLKKIFEWWKLKKKFRQGKTSHTLFFADKILTIASTPVILEEYLERLPEAQKIQHQDAINAIKNIHIKRINDLKTKEASETGHAPGSVGAGDEIKKEFEKIVELLGTIDEGKFIPPCVKGENQTSTPPIDSAIPGDPQVGKSMEMKLLSVSPGGMAGSAPTAFSKLYNAIKKRKGAYVRGHLLNSHVHGPGINTNLVPIDSTWNTSKMEPKVEDPLKRLVLNENEVVYYKAVAGYDKGDHIGQENRTHIPEEKYLPSHISFTLRVLKPIANKTNDDLKDPSAWEEDSTKSADGMEDQAIPLTIPDDYPVEGEVGEVGAMSREQFLEVYRRTGLSTEAFGREIGVTGGSVRDITGAKAKDPSVQITERVKAGYPDLFSDVAAGKLVSSTAMTRDQFLIVLNESKKSVTGFAEALGVSRASVRDITEKGKDPSVQMTERVRKVFPDLLAEHAQMKLKCGTTSSSDEIEAERNADTIALLQRATLSIHNEAPCDLPSAAGTALPPRTRHKMEQAFARDFSEVRVHSGPRVADLADLQNARAYTFGSDVYFNRGEYAPHTKRGQHLLAHELTHVVQQTRPGRHLASSGRPIPRTILRRRALSGDPKLEEVFDEKGFLGPPTKGPEVKKVQEALLALGFTLPKFGADARLWLGNASGGSRFPDQGGTERGSDRWDRRPDHAWAARPRGAPGKRDHRHGRCGAGPESHRKSDQ